MNANDNQNGNAIINTGIARNPIAIPDEPLYDLSFISSTGKDDSEFIQKLIAIFIEIMPVCVTELNEAAINGNLEQVRKSAHKMKSSIDLLCVDSLKHPIRQLETIKEDDINLWHYIETLDKTIEKVIEQLKKLI